MMDWLREYWYLLIVFAVVCVVAAVIIFFAARAYSRHNKEFRNQEQEIKRLLALKEKYLNFTPATVSESTDEELLEGVALSYQLRLQKAENPEKAFEELCQEKKTVYVLDVFCADADCGVFFRENGDILKSIILPSLEKISMKDFSEKLREIYDMFDIENEEASYSLEKIDRMNDLIQSENIIGKIRINSADYIRKNVDALLN